MTAKFQIGTKYKTRGKHQKVCTVVEILRTYNSKNELVKTRYVATHTGPLGQLVTDHDVCETTIAMGDPIEPPSIPYTNPFMPWLVAN